LGAENWFGRWSASAGTTVPPEDGKYHHVLGSGTSLIHLEVPNNHSERLIAQVSETDLRELPYDPGASSTQRGWYYALSPVDLTPSAIEFQLPWGGQVLYPYPVPTPWLVAWGAEDEMGPAAFLLDEINFDASPAAQEARRKELPSEVPAFNEVWRLYEDDLDVPAADLGAAPLAHLTEGRLRAAMEASPHLLSLSGHGSRWGQCRLSNSDWSSLANRMPFITYASGCMTAWYEGEDVMAQVAVNSRRGAVAYVGYSRDGWIIGPSDEVEETFFRALTATNHIGLLNDARLAVISPSVSADLRWMVFVQNLFGDPEMPIWTEAPRSMFVQWSQAAGEPVARVHVAKQQPGGGAGKGRAGISEALIRVRQGAHRWSYTTDDAGEATIDLEPEGLADLEVTVSADGYLPDERLMRPEGPGWITGRVEAIVEHAPASASTAIWLHIDDSDLARECRVPSDAPSHDEIVEAAVQAYMAGQLISLFVDDLQAIDVVRGFRVGHSAH
jgi:hypothetical protein